MFDKDGKYIYHKQGESNKVDLSDQKSRLALFNADYITHNHPSAFSLSGEDLSLGSAHNIQNTRAVGEYKGEMYIYEVSNIPKKYAKEISVKWKEIHDNLFDKYNERYYNGENENDLFMEHTHEIMEILSKEYNFAYRRTKKTDTK